MPVSVRYIVTDVDAAIAFYTESLGFQVVMHPAPGFAALTRDDLRLLLECARSRGSRTVHGRWSDAVTRWLEPHPNRGQ